jgi:hypothetical protein
VRQLDKVLDRVQEEILAPLSESERQELTDLLTRLLTPPREGCITSDGRRVDATGDPCRPPPLEAPSSSSLLTFSGHGD